MTWTQVGARNDGDTGVRGNTVSVSVYLVTAKSNFVKKHNFFFVVVLVHNKFPPTKLVDFRNSKKILRKKKNN